MEVRLGDEPLYAGSRGLGTTIRTIENQLAVHTLALAAIDVGPWNLLKVRHDIIISDIFLHGLLSLWNFVDGTTTASAFVATTGVSDAR